MDIFSLCIPLSKSSS